MQEHPACDVCSRTLLKGEQLHEYVSPQGQRFGVCVHCRARAEASGWIPAEQWGTVAHEPPSRGGRGAALRRRLGEVASRARGGARPRPSSREDDPPSSPEGDGEAATTTAPADEAAADEPMSAAEPQVLAPSAEHAAPAGTERRPKPPRAPRPRPQAKRDPKRPPATATGQAHQAPQPRRGPEAIMRAAVDRFNSSQEPRKVAGLIRSLGEPQAAVRPDPRRQLALVTVAWELSWYQWEVGANGDDESVREVAKGKEVSELTDDARAWNAAVGDDGSLRLRAASQRMQASGKEA